MPAAAAIGIVTVLFAAVHGLPDALPIVPLALVLGYVFHRTRSYVAVVTLHALFNSYNLILMSAYVLAKDLPGMQ
jgi:membrane protease YdiL (CAAX protease family)